MKILYAVQGTGNGHISRANVLLPLLQEHAEVDILISGGHSELKLPFPATYRCNGFGFYFGKKGGIDIARTFKKTKIGKLIREINELPVTNYDFILNDFEPVSAWAARKHGIFCIGLSHQTSLLSPFVPKPKKKNATGEFILKNYAPSDFSLGFHFRQYGSDIYLPLLRNVIKQAEPNNFGHYTVYLPAYSDERIIKVLSMVSEVKWEVFSKHCKSIYSKGNVRVQPVDEKEFTSSMIIAEGVLCGAGFETPAEAIHLGKKLMIIPMKNQYEQQCNAEALKLMGIPVLKKLSTDKIEKIRSWVRQDYSKLDPYEDHSNKVIEIILEKTQEIRKMNDLIAEF